MSNWDVYECIAYDEFGFSIIILKEKISRKNKLKLIYI